MSTRNIRKLVGGNVLPPPDDDDSDYEPIYSRKPSQCNMYAGLMATDSASEEETNNRQEEIERPEIETSEDDHNTTNIKNKTKKKKSKKSKKKSVNTVNLDDIDQTIKEVNELLGCLQPSPNIEDKPEEPTTHVFSVENKHLNVAYELRRVFGPDDENDGNRRRRRQPTIDRIAKRGIIIDMPEKFENLPKVGLTMSIERRENNVNYYVLNHNEQYQKVHRRYIENMLMKYVDPMAVEITYALRMMHIEELIEGANMMFRFEDYSKARTLLEQSIAYLQYISHPCFRLSDPNNRLEYKFMENRVFHVSILMYLHMLTNSASHRTALELAKMLLNLDPSDPLAMIFIIDTIALRAREHQWLIDLFEHWKHKRGADYVFNLLYSNALAHFHVAKKKKELVGFWETVRDILDLVEGNERIIMCGDLHGWVGTKRISYEAVLGPYGDKKVNDAGDLSHANSLLQDAIIRFPSVVKKLLEVTNTKNERIQSHALYNTEDRKHLRDLIHIYAKFAGAKWREPDVKAWFLENATAMIDKFENDSELKASVKKWNEQRMPMFRGLPREVMRHLSVIKPMARLLIDEDLPPYIPRSIRSADPLPWPTGENINRYNYKFVSASEIVVPNSGILPFFAAMRPDYRLPQDAAQRAEQEMHHRAEFYDDDNDDGNNLWQMFDTIWERGDRNDLHLFDDSDSDEQDL